MATATWDMIDNIIEMTYDDNPFSLRELEIAIAADDDVKTKELIDAMRGPSGKYKAEVYVFGGVAIAAPTQKARCRKWFKNGELIQHLLTQARLKDKEEKAADEMRVSVKKELKEKEEELARAKAVRDMRVGVDMAVAGSAGAGVAIDADGVSITSIEVDELVEGEETFSPTFDGSTDTVVEAVRDADGRIVPTLKRAAAKKPKKSKPTINIRDQIKFDFLKLDEEHSSFVPFEDVHYEYPGWTIEFTKLLDRGMNIWLYGGTGSGKSSLVEQVSAIGKMSVIYQSFHEDIKPDSLFGGKELVDGNTVWQDGPVTKAYREGHILLLDEIDGTPPEILFCLFSILDRKPLILADNGCEIIQPHKNFRVVATGNTLGRGDETGAYSGTNVLNKAFLNRFRIWYNVEYPSEAIYKKIIMKEGVSEPVAKVIARLAKEINAGAASGTLNENFSLRDAREVSRAADTLGGDIRRALQLTLLNRLGTAEQATISEIYRRLVPDDEEM